MSRSPQKKIRILSILIAILAVADILVISACFRVPGKKASVPATEPTEIQDETTEPEPTDPEAPVSTATVLATGDLLMHKKVIDSGKQEDGSYDFSSIFRYISPIVQQADYAVANLETTLAGTDNGYQYAGFPNFNSPDAIVDAVKNAGFDMLLTANNHSYDTTLVGYKRTLEVVRGAGLETLGTYLNADEQKWTIADINDIKVGMLCYTYATGVGSNGAPQLNGNAAIKEAGICNFFSYNNLPAFYSEVEGHLNDMKEAGSLFASEEIVHSYPHCWRCKNPIIFRTTEQWFCSVDALKDDAVKACEDIKWIPHQHQSPERYEHSRYRHRALHGHR